MFHTSVRCLWRTPAAPLRLSQLVGPDSILVRSHVFTEHLYTVIFVKVRLASERRELDCCRPEDPEERNGGDSSTHPEEAQLIGLSTSSNPEGGVSGMGRSRCALHHHLPCPQHPLLSHRPSTSSPLWSPVSSSG